MSHENNQPVNRVFVGALKSILKEAFKLCVIGFAWCMRLGGLILTKTGEAIEKIIIKKS
ncbi:hypothetical protein [Ferruginibacter sp.]|nr:hypothetical protein [Ferruginibacter sp.]